MHWLDTTSPPMHPVRATLKDALTQTLHTQTIAASTQNDISLAGINKLIESVHSLQYQLVTSKAQISQYIENYNHLLRVLLQTRLLAKLEHNTITNTLHQFQQFFKSKISNSSIESKELLNIPIYQDFVHDFPKDSPLTPLDLATSPLIDKNPNDL